MLILLYHVIYFAQDIWNINFEFDKNEHYGKVLYTCETKVGNAPLRVPYSTIIRDVSLRVPHSTIIRDASPTENRALHGYSILFPHSTIIRDASPMENGALHGYSILLMRVKF